MPGKTQTIRAMSWVLEWSRSRSLYPEALSKLTRRRTTWALEVWREVSSDGPQMMLGGPDAPPRQDIPAISGPARFFLLEETSPPE